MKIFGSPIKLCRTAGKINVWILIALGSIGGYVLLMPSLSPIPSFRPYVEKRTLQIGLLIVIGGVLVLSRLHREQWLSTFWQLPRLGRWGLSMVLGLGFLSSAFAPSPFYAFLEVAHFVLLFVAAGVIATAVRRASSQAGSVLLGLVAASAALYTVYFTVGYGMHFLMEDIALWPDGSTNFSNTRIFNQYQTWSLPLLAGTVLAIPREWHVLRGSTFGVTALWWALVLASNVRGTIVAMVIAAAGIGFLFRGRAKKWLAVQSAAVLGGLVLYYLLFASVEAESPPVADKLGTGSSVRLQHWRECLRMVWEHPWLGAGPMHFAWPPHQFTKSASPHNALMQWLGEWGLPSTAIMSGLTVWGGWRWMQQEIKAVRQGQVEFDPVPVALVAAILAGASHSMVSGLIVAPLSQVCLVLVAGWAWGRYQHERQSVPSPSVFDHAVLCILLVASMAVVGSSLQDLSTRKERRTAFKESGDWNSYHPRFWLQGYIGVRNSSDTEQYQTD